MDIPYLVVVLGFSGSGKTSFIQQLVKTATKSGLSCGVLKTGRSHSQSHVGNDSYLYLKAGASISWFWNQNCLETYHLSTLANLGVDHGSGSINIPLPPKEVFEQLDPEQLPNPIREAFSVLDLWIVEGRRLLMKSELDLAHDSSTIHLNIQTEKRKTPGLKYPVRQRDLIIHRFEEYQDSIHCVVSRCQQYSRSCSI